MIRSLALAAALLLLTLPASVQAQDATLSEETPAFERDFAITAYLSSWAGDYASIGVGGRVRYEPLDWFGIDLFGEAYVVDWPGAFRHDYPIGFNLYTPFEITEGFRLRPLFGFCAVFSFIEPAEEGGPRADDVLFGIHAGGGAELELSSHWSLFFDAQAFVYFGHDRTTQGWTGAVGEEIDVSTIAQMSLGVQLHL